MEISMNILINRMPAMEIKILPIAPIRIRYLAYRSHMFSRPRYSKNPLLIKVSTTEYKKVYAVSFQNTGSITGIPPFSTSMPRKITVMINPISRPSSNVLKGFLICQLLLFSNSRKTGRQRDCKNFPDQP